MAQCSAKSLYICTAIILALLGSVTASLSLEELSLKIQQLEQNDAAKDVRLKELELKVHHLQNKVMEQEKRCHTTHDDLQIVNLHRKQVEPRNAIFRTCQELHQADPSLPYGMYWIDPDGRGVGDDPIYVECDMATGKTSVPHDSERPTDVSHCADPGCYSRQINYSATMRQMNALAELSSECHQSMRYDCYVAPFETNGVAQSWWNDRNGVAQYFWAGSNNSIHTCQCGIDNNCVELYYLCNCDSAVPVPLNDTGVITDKKYLPITRLNFGRTQLETSSGVHTLGRFECSGRVSVSGVLSSCYDLWKIGYTLSGIYSVMGTDHIETVYCDFSILPYEQGFETLIGYSDVKSLPVYFYVQKNAQRNVTGIVTFELTRINVGEAMDASSGIFTAPRNGIYSFQLTGVELGPSASNYNQLRVALMLNGSQVGLSGTDQTGGPLQTYSLHSTLDLKAGDQLWISINAVSGGARLYDDSNHYTHFSGHLLQEHLARSIF